MHNMISYCALRIYRQDYSCKSHPPVFTSGSFANILLLESHIRDLCYMTCFLSKFVRECHEDTSTIFILSEYK